MVAETTYLELSETDGGTHKFYEVVCDGTQVSIRYGRIGDQGQTQSSNHATAEQAQKFAQKKLREKLNKGYERAVMGQRQKRSVTRRQIVSNRSTAKQAPVLWKFASGSAAFGIFIDERRCWLGNEAGRIFGLDHTGQVQAQYHLPNGVKCLVADDIWLYAGCDDGNVYDLSGKIPRVSYQIAPDVDIYWLDIRQGALAVSDASGRVALVNHEDESEWLKSTQYSSGWMVRCSEEGVCHGHSGGVAMYNNQDGSLIWQQRTKGVVLLAGKKRRWSMLGRVITRCIALRSKACRALFTIVMRPYFPVPRPAREAMFSQVTIAPRSIVLIRVGNVYGSWAQAVARPIRCSTSMIVSIL